MTGLMDRGFVVRLGSLAVVRKRAGRGSFAPGAPGAANEPRTRGPGRALSSHVRAVCDIVMGLEREFIPGSPFRDHDVRVYKEVKVAYIPVTH
jgi:hypothetical protein